MIVDIVRTLNTTNIYKGYYKMKKTTALLLVLGAFALTACGGPYQLTQQESGTAELGAVKYSQNANAKFLSCSGLDSDQDGYVTCTVDKAGVEESLACSYQSQGCKQK